MDFDFMDSLPPKAKEIILMVYPDYDVTPDFMKPSTDELTIIINSIDPSALNVTTKTVREHNVMQDIVTSRSLLEMEISDAKIAISGELDQELKETIYFCDKSPSEEKLLPLDVVEHMKSDHLTDNEAVDVLHTYILVSVETSDTDTMLVQKNASDIIADKIARYDEFDNKVYDYLMEFFKNDLDVQLDINMLTSKAQAVFTIIYENENSFKQTSSYQSVFDAVDSTKFFKYGDLHEDIPTKMDRLLVKIRTLIRFYKEALETQTYNGMTDIEEYIIDGYAVLFYLKTYLSTCDTKFSELCAKTPLSKVYDVSWNTKTASFKASLILLIVKVVTDLSKYVSPKKFINMIPSDVDDELRMVSNSLKLHMEYDGDGPLVNLTNVLLGLDEHLFKKIIKSLEYYMFTYYKVNGSLANKMLSDINPLMFIYMLAVTPVQLRSLVKNTLYIKLLRFLSMFSIKLSLLRETFYQFDYSQAVNKSYFDLVSDNISCYSKVKASVKGHPLSLKDMIDKGYRIILTKDGSLTRISNTIYIPYVRSKQLLIANTVASLRLSEGCDMLINTVLCLTRDDSSSKIYCELTGTSMEVLKTIAKFNYIGFSKLPNDYVNLCSEIYSFSGTMKRLCHKTYEENPCLLLPTFVTFFTSLISLILLLIGLPNKSSG